MLDYIGNMTAELTDQDKVILAEVLREAGELSVRIGQKGSNVSEVATRRTRTPVGATGTPLRSP